VESAMSLRHQLSESAEPQPFELTIGTRHELGMSWLVPSLTSLETARPERKIHLAFSNGKDLLDRLREREIDAFVASLRLSRADLAYSLLHEERYVLVGAPELLRRTPLRRPRDASAHCLLDIDSSLPLSRYF